MRIFITAIFLLFPQVLAACPAASDVVTSGVSASVLDNCHELERFQIPSGRGDTKVVIYGTQSSDEALVLPILEILTASGSTLAGIGALTTDPIEIFILPVVIPVDAAGVDPSATTHSSATEDDGVDVDTCVILVGANATAGEFPHLLAHEYFHCVQNYEFREMSGSAGASWWVEGTAEWFPNVVFPGTANSDGFVQSFDINSVRLSLLEMTYENVVFFHWIHQSRGSGGVIDIIRAMPTGGGSQADALAGIIGDPEMIDFALDYIERTITQPGGRLLPVTPRVHDTHTWEEDEIKRFEAERFRIYRANIEFSCGEWELEQIDLEGIMKLQKQPEGEWEDLPEKVASDDGETIVYRYIGVATGPDGFSAEIEAKKAQCSLCERPDPDDEIMACLFGTWDLASGGIGEQLSEGLLGIAGIESADYPDIDGILVLNEDGTFAVSTRDTGEIVSVDKDGDHYYGNVNINMKRTGTWGVNGSTLEQCYVRDRDVNIRETVEGPDVTVTAGITRFYGPRFVLRQKRKFTCAGGELTLREGGFFGTRMEWVYTK